MQVRWQDQESSREQEWVDQEVLNVAWRKFLCMIKAMIQLWGSFQCDWIRESSMHNIKIWGGQTNQLDIISSSIFTLASIQKLFNRWHRELNQDGITVSNITRKKKTLCIFWYWRCMYLVILGTFIPIIISSIIAEFENLKLVITNKDHYSTLQ